jgi:hypothetical protein
MEYLGQVTVDTCILKQLFIYLKYEIIFKITQCIIFILLI